MRFELSKAPYNKGVSFWRFKPPINDLGDFVVLFFKWEFKVFL
jgi:hypothetical protein